MYSVGVYGKPDLNFSAKNRAAFHLHMFEPSKVLNLAN
jgi:hypothetical protein